VLLPRGVPWYRERPLRGISLGSLVFVVLLRCACLLGWAAGRRGGSELVLCLTTHRWCCGVVLWGGAVGWCCGVVLRCKKWQGSLASNQAAWQAGN
jgi:hypothetical protein